MGAVARNAGKTRFRDLTEESHTRINKRESIRDAKQSHTRINRRKRALEMGQKRIRANRFNKYLDRIGRQDRQALKC